MAMLNSVRISHAIDMQQRSYRLLQWMASAVQDGFISFETAHDYSNLPDAAAAWIAGHYNNIPENARVPQESLPEFSAFFSTYLINSFDLVASPGKQLYSPGAHCFCPMCSWLVAAPNLKTKKLTPADKRRAGKLRIQAATQIAIDNSVVISSERLEDLLKDEQNRTHASLVAYSRDLLLRLEGVATGPAILALWRGFAWNQQGSPVRDFRLKTKMVVRAEANLLDAINNAK